MKNWVCYEKIQEMKRNHLNKSQIARKLQIDRRTVMKYWDMTADEFARVREGAKKRKKKADEYKPFILECLRKYPDMSAAQINDWLLEMTGRTKMPFGERSLRSYVENLRKEYKIKKPDKTRQHEAVDDPAYGDQGQVDLGEITLKKEGGGHKKIYGFAMVLSNSRYKFVCWQAQPFTTASFVEAHIKAFKYFGGRPRELVYDQDKVLAVSENHGDIIYTEGFQNYLNAVGFNVFLCRGSDPQSKGRVEAVIKYAKNNFAKHRVFKDIDSFNQDCLAWLARTGNAKEHSITKKIPAKVFTIEKEYLMPVSEYSFAKLDTKSITYGVRKDNTVLYRSNRYRVPIGTYRKGKRVHVIIEGEDVIIEDADTGVLLAHHPLCHEQGKLIGDKSRNTRDKSKTILELEAGIKELFGKTDGLDRYLTRIHKEKSRYYRDQLGVIRQLFDEWKPDTIRNALIYCIEHESYSASELKSATAYIATLEEEKKYKEQSANKVMLPEKYRGDSPPVRDLSIYEHAMERRIGLYG